MGRTPSSAVVGAAACATIMFSAMAQDEKVERFGSPAWGDGEAPPYAAMVAHGDTLYLAGVLGKDIQTGAYAEGVQAQTTAALDTIELVLSQVGATAADILNCTVFLADIDDYARMNTAYAEFFGEVLPARSTVATSLPDGADVEIACTAARPEETAELSSATLSVNLPTIDAAERPEIGDDEATPEDDDVGGDEPQDN